MKRKFLIFTFIVVIFLAGAVSAHENTTDNLSVPDSSEDTLNATQNDALEKTYFYDEDGDEYPDDTVVTHNVVKYYGDTDTRFKVVVYNNDYTPAKDIIVSFSKNSGKYKEKTTNSKGIVYFPLNYDPGTYEVETCIETADGTGYWFAFNTVKVKSTIQPKELVKYSSSKKKFKITFLDSKGNALKNNQVKLKINGKTYNLKTDSNGIVKIKSTRFKVGKHKITAYNPSSGEKRKLSVVVLKKGTHRINIRVDDPTGFFPDRKLKNGDHIYSVYETQYRQYNPGVYVECTAGGLENSKHTKLLKAKFYFKNKKTGKVITKTSKKVRYNYIVVKPVKGYSPYKATVWYKDKK